jgi:hypothetical protein
VVAATVAFCAAMLILMVKGQMATGVALLLIFGLPLLNLSLFLVFGPSGASRSDGMIAEQLRTDLEAKPLSKRTEEDHATLYLLQSGFIPRRDANGRFKWRHPKRMSIDGDPLRASEILARRGGAGAQAKRFFSWLIGAALLIPVAIFLLFFLLFFLLPSAISAFEKLPLVWQLVIIATVAVGFIVHAIERAARYIRNG